MQRIPNMNGMIEIFFTAMIIATILGAINLAIKNNARTVNGQPIINFIVFKRCCFMLYKNYSYRNASIGDNFAALIAGAIPKITPTAIEKKNAKKIDQGVTSE